MPTAAQPQGIAVIRPTCQGSVVSVSVMICGSQKVTPYKPITTPKYTRHNTHIRKLRNASMNADFRGAKSAHILHRNLQCFSRILLLFVSGFSFLTSWIVTPLFRYSHRIVEAQKALGA